MPSVPSIHLFWSRLRQLGIELLRGLLWGLFLLLVSLPLVASEKKGIGIASPELGERVEALKVAWYYTWKPDPLDDAHASFVPMLSGGPGSALLEQRIAAMEAQEPVHELLVINEPHKEKHANLSVEQVLDLWPRLQPLGERVGSPAVGVHHRGQVWLRAFKQGLDELGMSMDFLSLHFYGPPDAKAFLRRIDTIHNRFQMPIWITEFAVRTCAPQPCAEHYSEAQVKAFMAELLPEMEQRDYIERYAWFGAGRRTDNYPPLAVSRLFEADGKLSELGRFYADFHWPPGHAEKNSNNHHPEEQ